MSVELADLLFPDIKLTTSEIIQKYPKRSLPEGAMVTRIAPSPTGYLHIGSLYAAFISWRLAKQSNGIFYLRLEDTDGSRMVEGAAGSIVRELNECGIYFDEGCNGDGEQTGNYGPYVQSERKTIYQTFIKELVAKDMAYPCFCGKAELDLARTVQREQKLDIGYYGEWAKCRQLSINEIKNNIDRGIPFVIRLRAQDDGERVIYQDLFKGRLEFSPENKDTIILKTDGLPTYHFAHCIDDTLMGTTHVLRGDEWIASLPTHRRLFQAVGFDQPIYGHIAPIVKIEGQTKRKYSKRKDMDGLASYFLKEGYQAECLHEYFLTLVNSGFEQWREKNAGADNFEYKIDINKLSASGAVLDKDKLRNICKNMIALYSVDKVYSLIYDWAKKYDGELFTLIKDEAYMKAILSIGRNQAKPRKDIELLSGVKNAYGYFFDGLFLSGEEPLYLETIELNASVIFMERYLISYKHSDNKDDWFNKLKIDASLSGFCADMKEYKKNKEQYLGSISDAAALIRIALTNRLESPDLYEIQQVMGEEMVNKRIERYLYSLRGRL